MPEVQHSRIGADGQYEFVFSFPARKFKLKELELVAAYGGGNLKFPIPDAYTHLFRSELERGMAQRLSTLRVYRRPANGPDSGCVSGRRASVLVDDGATMAVADIETLPRGWLWLSS